MPLSLRIKLWLGWFFGWDKGGIRFVLFLIAVWSVMLGYACVIEPMIFPEPGVELTAQEDAELRERLNELLKDRDLSPIPSRR